MTTLKQAHCVRTKGYRGTHDGGLTYCGPVARTVVYNNLTILTKDVFSDWWL